MIRVRMAKNRDLLKSIQDNVTRALAESAGDLRETARDLVNESSGGGPSRPGTPPHRDSGRLHGSIFVRTRGLSARIGTDLDYGAHLEFGTQTMAARPWLHPAFEVSKNRIKARLKAAVRDALRSSGSL